MTLIEQYPQAFDGLGDSPLKGLLQSVKVFNFDKEDYTDRDLSDHIGLGDAIETSTFLDVFAKHKLSNLVQTSNDDIVYELFIASIILKKPRLFINNPVTILNSQESSVQPMRLWQENFNATEHKRLPETEPGRRPGSGEFSHNRARRAAFLEIS